ncbi:MAG: hypothetical protein ACP5O0_07615 [Acidimicrobiales bacterium]
MTYSSTRVLDHRFGPAVADRDDRESVDSMQSLVVRVEGSRIMRAAIGRAPEDRHNTTSSPTTDEFSSFILATDISKDSRQQRPGRSRAMIAQGADTTHVWRPSRPYDKSDTRTWPAKGVLR